MVLVGEILSLKLKQTNIFIHRCHLFLLSQIYEAYKIHKPLKETHVLDSHKQSSHEHITYSHDLSLKQMFDIRSLYLDFIHLYVKYCQNAILKGRKNISLQ